MITQDNQSEGSPRGSLSPKDGVKLDMRDRAGQGICWKDPRTRGSGGLEHPEARGSKTLAWKVSSLGCQESLAMVKNVRRVELLDSQQFLELPREKIFPKCFPCNTPSKLFLEKLSQMPKLVLKKDHCLKGCFPLAKSVIGWGRGLFPSQSPNSLGLWPSQSRIAL